MSRISIRAALDSIAAHGRRWPMPSWASDGFAEAIAWLETRRPGLAGRLKRRLLPRSRVYVDASSHDRSCQVLLVTHDLSLSGAPKIVLELAKIFLQAGYGVTVASPSDGPLRPTIQQIGVNLIVDADAFEAGHGTLATLARCVDIAFCNSIVTRGAVRALHAAVPTVWYLHEVSLIQDWLAADRTLAADLALPSEVWCGSELSAALVRPSRTNVRIVPYGIEPLSGERNVADSDEREIRIAVFGSLEPRKGQDLALEALALLPSALQQRVHLTFYGRTLDAAFEKRLVTAMRGLPASLGGELDPAAYREAVSRTDMVLVSSRDDTLPLVSLDALSARRILACTSTTGTAAYLTAGVDGFVSNGATAPAIATMLQAALACIGEWPTIAERGAVVFAESFSVDRFRDLVVAQVEQAVKLR